jgi:hypothetical protein
LFKAVAETLELHHVIKICKKINQGFLKRKRAFEILKEIQDRIQILIFWKRSLTRFMGV